MRERFEEEFGKDQYGGKQAFRQVFVTPFIEKEIQLALKEQREEIVEMAKPLWKRERHVDDQQKEDISIAYNDGISDLINILNQDYEH